MFNRLRLGVAGVAAMAAVGLASTQLMAGLGFDEPPCVGFIKGTVVYSGGGTGEIKIHVIDTDGNTVFETASDRNGEFFVELAPGRYEVLGLDGCGGSTSVLAVIPECDKIAEVTVRVEECR